MTTAKPKIPTLSENPSKQEEMDFLNAVFDAVPKHAYLREWVSQDMMRWLDFQIRDDQPCDIYAGYQHEIAEGESLRASNSRLLSQVAALEEKCGNYAKQCHDYGAENQKQKDQLFNETTDVQMLTKTVDTLAKENENMRDTIGRHYDRTKVLTDLVWKFGSDDQKDRDDAQQFFDDARAVGAFQ